MRAAVAPLAFAAALSAAAAACVPPPPPAVDDDAGAPDGDAGADDDAGATGLAWFTTCGDPSCRGFTAPSGVPLCDDQQEGAACAAADERCAIPGDDCNTQLVCADQDPKQQPGGCPISRVLAKDDVRFVDDATRRDLAAQLYALPLATWTYVDDPTSSPRLGFLIDDAAPPACVLPNGRQVDVYGYTSLAVAALQEQRRELDALKAEVAALRAARPTP